MPCAPELAELKNLPEDTFGFAVYKHMNTNGLDFSIWPTTTSDIFIKYFSTRIYQDHDLWHTLLAYGIEVEDELALQAFNVAQFRSPVGVLLIAGGLLHLLGKDPTRAVTALKKINEGYTRGLQARFMLSIRLHDLLTQRLDQVRQICGLQSLAA